MNTILDQYKTPYEVSQDIARNMEEFLELFKKKFYRTIDEVINEQD